jgi:hypothetical protein
MGNAFSSTATKPLPAGAKIILAVRPFLPAPDVLAKAQKLAMKNRQSGGMSN